jgi:glycosyltransferase involved in cell wall biosynthesis
LQIEFWLIGEPDPGNPDSISESDLSALDDDENIKVLGFRRDIPFIFSQSNIIVFPSYYGEGLPKVLIEAAASGRPVITTDHPGCRDAIRNGETGLLVPVRNPKALADAIEILVADPELRHDMGASGRALAEGQFCMDKVVTDHLKIYKTLLNGPVA